MFLFVSVHIYILYSYAIVYGCIGIDIDIDFYIDILYASVFVFEVWYTWKC